MNASPFQRNMCGLLESLPVPTRLDESHGRGVANCVIGIAGFEPRCRAAIRSLRELGWRADRTLCLRYCNANMDSPNRMFFGDMHEELSLLSQGRSPEVLDHNDHGLDVDFGQQLLHTLHKMGIDLQSAATHIVFDITVGSSRLLLEGLHALLQTEVRLTLAYTEVSSYRPSFDEYRRHLEERRVRQIEPPEFLTHGVDRVEVLKSIPGRNADARPAYLVVFPGFAFTRVSAVIDELAPSRVQWIFGIPHLVSNRWRIDAQRDYHQSLIERSHRHCFVSTFDYRETLDVLEQIYRKRRGEYGIFVASLGSKMQKVGQALFHVLRPEAAAVVSIPRIWNDDRFSDETPRGVYMLDLGECGDLRKALWQTRQLRVS